MLMLINVWVEVGQEEGWGGGEGGGRGGAIGQWHSKILMKSVNIWTLRLIFFFTFELEQETLLNIWLPEYFAFWRLMRQKMLDRKLKDVMC